MRIEKNRYLAILGTLIRQDGEYCSSEHLAHKAMASVRTIKSDIQYLDELLNEDGSCYIESAKSKGYRLVIEDPEKYEALCETVRVYQIIFRTQSIEKANRRLFILQTLLAEDAVKIDDLADSLFVSRSTLKEDMSWVNDFVRSFHLELVSVPGRGLIIRGREQDIRSAMLEVICSQYHDIEFMYPVGSFYRWFNLENYDDVRHEMLKVIRESDISISDIGGKKLASYLCLAAERCRRGYLLHFTDEEKDRLNNTYVHELAGTIFSLPSVRSLGEMTEEEQTDLARHLKVVQDVDLKEEKDRRHLDDGILQDGYALFDGFVSDMKESGGYRFFQSAVFLNARDEITSVLVRILLQLKYDHADQKRMITYTEMEDTRYSPLSMEYARIMTGYLKQKLDSGIAVTDIRALTGILHYLLNRLPADYRKQRLAVFSMEGRALARRMRDELLEQYDPYIEKADVFDLYEMRRIDFADYDASVASWDVAYYAYPIPLVIYTGTEKETDRDRLFTDLFVKGYSFDLLRDLQEMTVFYPASPVRTYMDLFKELAERFGRDPEHAEAIIRKAVSRFSSVSYYDPGSGISTIFLDYEDTGEELLEIYEPASAVFWGSSMEIRFFIVVCMRPDRDLSDIRISHHLLYYLCTERRQVRQIRDDKDNALRLLYLRVLKNMFL